MNIGIHAVNGIVVKTQKIDLYYFGVGCFYFTILVGEF